ncbi:MAG: Gfo/Idh/MocA family oxidoreductase [Verrucomicrobia bacterium]|nr:Gfo/Idh/MocA family oxidoreductase [Verrucomicrobiota bacterium]
MRVAFIGAGGFITAHHLHIAGHSKIMTVHAICDLDDQRLAQHEARYHPRYVTKDYRRILADPDADIVIIGTKQDLHARLIVEALDSGKWVLCEKPMAETQAETAAVLAAEARATGKLAIGFNRRFAPAYQRAKRLIQTQRPPFFVNYRMMWPVPSEYSQGYYENKPHMLYEGTHILDFLCWLLESEPTRVYMTGDPFKNNLLALDFPGGSRASFLLGRLGSCLLWKEYLEIFCETKAVTISDFVDLRVRGFPGEFDEACACHLGEQAAGIGRHGFDYYEVCRACDVEKTVKQWSMGFEQVRRPGRDFGPNPFKRETDYASSLVPDKGWVESLEHFARCFLEGRRPENADGRAGALATQLALRAVESLRKGQALDFTFQKHS